MRKTWTMALAGLLVVASLSGCAGSNGTGQTGEAGGHTQSVQPEPRRSFSSITHGFRTYTQGVNENNYRKGFTSNGYNQNQAELLTRAAHDVPGVVRASVIVSGSDAVVGIVVRSNLRERQVDVIKRQVYSAARSVAPGLNIRVTADPQMFRRLRELNAAIYQEATRRQNNVRIGANHPQSSVANDFSQMLEQLEHGISPGSP